jgi:hypothetical protein
MQMKPELAMEALQGTIWERKGSETSSLRLPDQPPLVKFCCGETILPKWARVKDRSGSEFGALIWACPRCALVTYHRVACVPPGIRLESSSSDNSVGARLESKAQCTRLCE